MIDLKPSHFLSHLMNSILRKSEAETIASYIRRNLAALAKEHKDGIW